MSIFLVVNVLDVFYHSRKATTVKANDNISGDSVLQPSGEEGKYEVKLAAGVTSIVLTVQEPDYNTITQKLQLTLGPPPALSYTGNVQELNVRNLAGSSRGTSDFNVEVFVVLGQLTDASAKVQNIANTYNITISPRTIPVMDFDALTVVSTISKGWDRFNHKIVRVSPTGTVLFAERTTIPRLIALFVPNGVVVQPNVDRWEASSLPLNFHLFYHPSPSKLKGNYPYDFAFVDLISRYMFLWRFLHKNMVNQQTQSGATPIMIFPVGDPVAWNGSFGGQLSVLELLFEVRYFVQRMMGIPYPGQPVGKCAVSGFSASGTYVNRALVPENPYFMWRVLKEIYGFDLREVDANTFATNLKPWYSHASGAAFRVYTALGSWWSALKSIEPSAVQTTGQDGAMEMESPQSSLVFVPFNNFWIQLAKETNQPATLVDVPGDYQVFRKGSWDDVHQLFPALFLEHALRHSNLK